MAHILTKLKEGPILRFIRSYLILLMIIQAFQIRNIFLFTVGIESSSSITLHDMIAAKMLLIQLLELILGVIGPKDMSGHSMCERAKKRPIMLNHGAVL